MVKEYCIINTEIAIKKSFHLLLLKLGKAGDGLGF